MEMTIATGKLAAPYIRKCVDKVQEKFPNVRVNVRHDCQPLFWRDDHSVRPDHRYRSLTAAERKGPGRKTSSAVQYVEKRREDIFLDDVSVEELEKELETEIVIVDEDGADLVASILDSPSIINR